MKLRVSAAAVVAAATLALTACGSGTGAASGQAAGPQPLTLGILTDIRSWDSSQAHVGHLLQPYQFSYDSLLLREPDGKLSPMLATKWQYNADNTVLTMDLRTDVTFSDGTKFDAPAVKANMDNFKKANGPQMQQLSAVKEVKALDPAKVEIDLSKPDPSLEYYMSQAAGLMESPKAIGTPEVKTGPVGSGPYIMDKATSVAGSQYVFTANPNYWNKNLQKFSKVTLKYLQDPTARVNAIVSGQVDGTLLDPKTGKQADGAGLKLVTNQVDWAGLLFFDRNGEVNKPLGDVRVRQAINYAIDRKQLLDTIMFGQGTPTAQVFGLASGASVDTLDNAYPYDPQKAKALLKEAGFETGVTIEVPTLPGSEALLAAVKQQLSEVGVTFNAGAALPTTYTSDIAAKKFPAMYFQLFQGEPWVAINQMISTKALYNPFKTTTPELQAKIDAVETAGKDAGKAAQEVDKYVTDNAWFAPFYRVNQMYYVNSKKVTVTPQIQQAVPSIYNYAPAK
ncbi:ABC transporter substrate-binding protein [Sinomonas sp. ASV486]|uniref:ABC transporter substrate-binding protein n=1 Tax=Sinomonas puerhi TaxID=3238584 RepID=A0AB39L5N2_9MICC|nr:ABC transporter substrate-binding protein [Sinomonas sp. ASV486]MDQ4490145.1 ABC transporter substrate-binding protein [Sinomonas sp. ASV486]